MNILKLTNVSKHFLGNQVLNGISFNVAERSITGLIGANGAGKTTLFNCITGFIQPDEGTIYFMDTNITSMKPYRISREGIIRTFQVVKPFGEMTVLENVMVGAFAATKYHNRAERAAQETLEFLGIPHFQDKLARHLTTADRKKLELARALAAKPKLLLLDEVMGGLNLSEVRDMVEIIKRINERKITILMIEHIMQAVMELAGHIVVLDHGAKIAEGTPQEISSNQTVIEAYLGKDEVNVAKDF